MSNSLVSELKSQTHGRTKTGSLERVISGCFEKKINDNLWIMNIKQGRFSVTI
jgi:hypothetical protein